MPQLVTPALPAGHLNRLAQPTIDVDDELSLRPWQPSDAPAVRAAFDCPDIQRWHAQRLDDEPEALAWIADWQKRWQDEKAASWAISRAGTAIGQIGLRRLSLFEADAGISYWILPPARGRGIAVQALQALTAWSFNALGLNRLHLLHSTANHASCRVAAKASFDLEGIMRRCMRHADGWHDMHLHARLNVGRVPGEGFEPPSSSF